ncbi:DUF859 family phage minor structural protein [Bacillus altitudinis]|uniref:DUF859 family phage minor structural protein n=1 Tax=Bacillus altitudinis TaxID=293387 RepID=UPI0021013A3A|nr:DUF859 family phage minor structural protein [Bacillus altitudinis]UTV34883.1 DUF859 domain-containing protein [Bacillus altitudinis]
MALSGSYYTNVSEHWRLQLEWSGSQNVTGNYTNITAKMYWIARDGYGAVYSSATKTSAIQYNNGSWHTESGDLAKLSPNQKKLINTYSFRINHDSDGTASFSIDGYFDAEVTLNGKFYGRIDLDQKTYTLNTIPRKSSISSSRNFTAGSNYTITISRASSSFTHKVYIDVKDSGGNWKNIKSIDFSSSQTSKSSAFTVAENTEIFKALNGRSSMDTRINLHTYASGDDIGTNTYTGTVTCPLGSGISNSNRDMYIDSSYTFQMDRENSSFTHTLKIQTNSDATLVKTVTGVGASYAWTPTQAEMDVLYGAMPNDTYMDGNVEITTFYNGVTVRSARNFDINFLVRNSNPKFSATTVNYVDSNSATVAVTGDGSKIVQNLSTIKVTLPSASKAVAQNKSTMKQYIATLGNQEVSANYGTGDIVFDFKAVNAKVDQTVVIKAIDSRGFMNQISKTITVVPYSPPVINGQAKRKNGFEDTTTFSAKGSMTSLMIGSTEKNVIKTVKFRYKKSTDPTTVTTWANWRSMTFTKSGLTFIGTNVSIDLINSSSFNVEFQVTDNFSTTFYAMKLGQGRPIMFMDAVKKTIGIGKFSTDYMLDVGGNANIDGNITTKGAFSIFNGIDMGNTTIKNVLSLLVTTLSVSGDASISGKVTANQLVTGSNLWGANGTFGLDLRNSDVQGANNIFFADPLAADTEGIQFPKSTTTDVTDTRQNDTLRGYDGDLYFNSKEIMHEGNFFVVTGMANMPSTANTPTSVTVKYGRTFPSAPNVVVTPDTTVPGKTVQGWSVTDVTTTGFTLWGYRTNTTAYTIHWVAVWKD